MVNVTGMRILTIVNQDDAGPGVFADAAAEGEHEVVTWRPAAEPRPELDGLGATMVFGGAMNVDEEDLHPWLADEKRLLAELVESGSPVLGVCLGAQMLAEAAGGSAGRAPRPEIGWHEVELCPDAGDDPVLGPLPHRFEAFQWHSYEATPPRGSVPLAGSDVCLAAFRIGELAWGIQFHAEVSEAIAAGWIEKYDNDPDAVRIEIDPEALRAETLRKIGAWNELGRGLSRRFVEQAEGRYSGVT